MGGFGSGEWHRYNSKKTTEGQHQIDVRLLKKWGYLNGSTFIGTWSWSRNGKITGSISYRLETEKMYLNYRHRPRGGNWETVQQEITFDRTRCNYGRHRYWFLCPRCSRRVAVLYGAGKYFLCRHCHRLAYSCQQEGVGDRMMRKARRIRQQLGGSRNLLDRFPDKPKNMHWNTYYRLRNKAMRAQLISLRIMEQKMRQGIAFCDSTLKRVAKRIS